MSVTIESKPTRNSADFDPITSSVVQCVVEDSLDGNGLACHLELARRMESEATTNFADFDAEMLGSSLLISQRKKMRRCRY